MLYFEHKSLFKARGEELFDELDGPVIRVAARDVPMPFSPPLERYVLPGPKQVVAAVRRLL